MNNSTSHSKSTAQQQHSAVCERPYIDPRRARVLTRESSIVHRPLRTARRYVQWTDTGPRTHMQRQRLQRQTTSANTTHLICVQHNAYAEVVLCVHGPHCQHERARQANVRGGVGLVRRLRTRHVHYGRPQHRAGRHRQH